MPADSGVDIDDDILHKFMYIPEKINKCIDLLAEYYLKDTGLKSYYIPYILRIGKNDGISQKELRDFLPFDKSRISTVVNELIQTGLVTNDGEGRNTSLHLTEKGLAAVSVSRMFFNITMQEVFRVGEMNDEIARKTAEFNEHLDSVMSKYGQK